MRCLRKQAAQGLDLSAGSGGTLRFIQESPGAGCFRVERDKLKPWGGCHSGSRIQDAARLSLMAGQGAGAQTIGSNENESKVRGEPGPVLPGFYQGTSRPRPVRDPVLKPLAL